PITSSPHPPQPSAASCFQLEPRSEARAEKVTLRRKQLRHRILECPGHGFHSVLAILNHTA
ncbi:MAG: hypothetical protein ACK55Z_28185, partial [bacterium]